MEYILPVDPESNCWTADVVPRDGFKLEQVILHKDGKDDELDEKDFWMMLILEPENSVAHYILKNPEEFPLMLSGKHKKFNLSTIAVSSKGRMYFYFNGGDGLAMMNVIEVNGAYEPRLRIRGLGNKYAEQNNFYITIKIMDPISDEISQCVNIDMYFGDEHFRSLKTAFKRNENGEIETFAKTVEFL